MRFRFILFIASILAVAGYSCKEKGGQNLDEGEIHYTIEYIGTTNSILDEYKPKNLVVSFKDDKILFEILAPIGNSGIINLTNPKEGIYDTYISVLSMKYYYAADEGEVNPGFESMKGMVITKTSKESVICGFNCKNAEVTLPADRSKVYNIWYTDEIKLKNPNASTPFSEIDGVLMSFFFFIGTTELRFNAETVYKKDIPDKAFERRDQYIRISRENISKIINTTINM